MTDLKPELLIASLAVEAMLHEAAAGPKPGLVDPFSPGAHRDMDLFTFCSSASALHPYFRDMVLTGMNHISADPEGLLEKIRPIGIEAEKAMFRFTEGINTHKGLIFSLGVLCASAGFLLGRKQAASSLTADQLCGTASSICVRIVERELEKSGKTGTNGEKLYRKLGIRGIRGEAEAGFPSVMRTGLPALKSTSGKWNSRLVDTLLHLMAVVEDSNVVARGGSEALERIRKQSREALAAGGISKENGMEIVRQMDVDFTERNISPGGSADLLAVTLFLYKIEDINF